MTTTRRSYGLWESSLSAADVSAAVPNFDFPLYSSRPLWVRNSSSAAGRVSELCTFDDGEISVLVPDVRTTVHEYGGLAYGVSTDGTKIVWSDFSGRLFINPDDPTPITPRDDSLRYGQPIFIDDDVVAICEDHSAGDASANVANYLVRITPSGSIETIAEGADFYIDPVAGPDGQIFYTSWNHPNMPWTATELHVIEPGSQSRFTADHRRIGTAPIAVQPTIYGDYLYFMADPENWLNLYRVPLSDLSSDPQVVYPIDADCAPPAWAFGLRSYAVTESEIFVSVSNNGYWELHAVSAGRKVTDAEPARLATNGADVVGRFSSPTEFQFMALVTSGGLQPLTERASIEIPISVPEAITYEVPGGVSHAFFYPPVSQTYQAPKDERPPLVVMAHGGPTSQSHADLNPAIQFWTSRGFAVVDVNYRGSTGWGATYRRLLNGNWGVSDIQDCVGAVEFLASGGRIDPERVAIRGGSAGGYTTLAALTFTDVFTAGASYYGIGDLGMLARDTHKFESRYPESLIAPYPDPLYEQRSPINHIDQLSAPIILLQGLDDRVVPPNQAQAMADAVRAKGLEVEHIEFEGEGHGFRKTENQIRALEAELAFYQRVWKLGTPEQDRPTDARR